MKIENDGIELLEELKKVDMEILNELSEIRLLLQILAEEALRKKLEEVATTKIRRKMWILFDGTLSTEEIAKKLNVTQRAVQIFVYELKKKDLIVIERRGYPRRRFDYIPSDWRLGGD